MKSQSSPTKGKVYLISICCVLGGLLIGSGGTYICAIAYWGQQTIEGLTLLKQTEISESDKNAFTAYQHESPEVAIYALHQHLAKLAEIDQISGTNSQLITKADINFSTMLAHARLAKVYTAVGKSDLGNQNIAEALKCATLDPKLGSISNETALMQVVSRSDVLAAK